MDWVFLSPLMISLGSLQKTSKTLQVQIMLLPEESI